MATLSSFQNGLSNGPTRAEDFRKGISDLQSVRNLRRASQPAALQNYRRDSLTRGEPIQSYRRGSVAPPQQPRLGYTAMDSIVRQPQSQDYQNYRRDSITSRPVDSFKPEVTGRRGSDADDINWIAKYQKSDHHTDRLVNTKLEYDKAIGRNITVQPNEPSTFRSVKGTFDKSQLPPQNPYRYEGTSKLTVFLQPTRNDSGQRKAEEVHRSIRQRSSSSYAPSTMATNTGRHYYSPSVITDTYGGSLPPTARYSAAQTGSTASRFDHRNNAFHRQSSTAGTSLPSSPALGRRNSVDSNLYKTYRTPDYTSRLERRCVSPLTPHTISDTRGPSLSMSSKYMTEPIQTASYRPYFNRAPSLPPFLPSGSSSNFSSSIGGGGNRAAASSAVASDVSSRRSSLANFSDLSSSNYRRSLDFGTLQGYSDTFKSPYRSTLGSDIHRNVSHETPLRRSSISRFSPQPSALSSFPPPPDRNFGIRGTHGQFRRSRSVIDG